jgi:hypothetical protein
MVRDCFGLFKMPSYYSLTTPNYDIHVEPIGIRKYLQSLPYLSGGFLVFDLYAYDRNIRQMPLEYEWQLLRMHRDEEYYEYDNKKGWGAFNQCTEDRQSTLWTRLIIPEVSASGQYKLQLRVEDEMDWSTIVDFEQLSRDQTVARLIVAGIGFAGLIIGAIIGGIIGWALKG